MITYQIKTEILEGVEFVHTEIEGIMNVESRNKVALEKIKFMREKKIDRVLWDIRNAKLDYTLIGSHMIVTNLDKLGVTEKDRIAVLYELDKEQHEHSKNVALNRGIFNLSYFTRRDEALKWLISRK